MKFDEWIREERRCGRKPGLMDCWNAALRHGVESQNTSTNKPMVAALDDIRAIVFGRGDSVTKVQKVQDRITRLNVTKA
jgi:hypothetical protein